MLKWMEKVNANANAKYLKGVEGSYTKGKFTMFNITGIEFSSDLIAPKALSSNNIKMAFVQDNPDVPAMSIAHAYEMFNNIANLCAEKGIDPADVGVYLQNEKGRLTRFAWYYDDSSDTAVVIKNVPWQEVAKFLSGAEVVLQKAATRPVTADDLIDELARIEDQIKNLNARKDKVYAKMDKLPYMGEDDLSDEGI